MDAVFAPGVALPNTIATDILAILGLRGAGKTNTGKLIAEIFEDLGAPFTILDPQGVWWGIRANKNGEDNGSHVLIFGGPHGDLAIQPGHGAAIAKFVHRHGISAVLDLKGMDVDEKADFAADYLNEFRALNRSVHHIFLDEAHNFAPQTAESKEQHRCRKVVSTLVLEGRTDGIGLTIMSQRTAMVNKTIISQVTALIAHKSRAKQDRAPIVDWAKNNVDAPLHKKVVAGLGTLGVGEVFFLAPDYDVGLRVQLPQARTYDSSRTPVLGEEPRQIKPLSPKNLAAFQEELATVIHDAEAHDPEKLGARIQELEAENRALRSKPGGNVVERIEVPVFSDEDRELLVDVQERLDSCLDAQQSVAEPLLEIGQVLSQLVPQRPAGATGPGLASAAVSKPTVGLAPHREPRADGLMPKQMAILNALAALEGIGCSPANRDQVALVANANPASSVYANNLGALRNAKENHDWPPLIEYPRGGHVLLTAEGRARADAGAAPATVEALHAFVRNLVKETKWRILEALIDAYPEAVAKEELAERAGARPKSSGYANNLGSLRRLGLLDYPAAGMVRAEPILFLEAP